MHDVLPHAERGVRSFKLTCLAEGCAAVGDDEKSKGKGSALVCNLTLASVHTANTLSDQKLACDADTHVSRLVTETAKRAAELTKLIAPTEAGNGIAPGALYKEHK